VHAFRLRELSVSLETPDRDLADALAHLVNRAADDYPTARHVTFGVTRRADAIELTEDQQPRRRVADVNAMLTAIHRRIATHLLAVHDPRPALHAGAVTIAGRLIVVTGNRGAGKTTLLLRLALEGAIFHCDEHVIAGEDGRIRTLPRRLHVKPGTLACLPEIAEACRRHPLLQLDGGVAFYPLDVAELGFVWRSADDRAAAIIHLEPSFERAAAIAPIAQIDMVQRLMKQMLGDLDYGRHAASVCAAVRGVPCYAMQVGPLEESAALVRRVAGAA
jgi:hypothetical protein